MKTIPLTTPHLEEAPARCAGGIEGARRATEVPPGGAPARQVRGSAPDPEVTEKKPRRKFTAKYKLQILQQADACTDSGQLGALLRREGLYSSNLTLWREQREQGLLKAMEPKKRGRKLKERNHLSKRIAQLEKEIRNLQDKLRKAEAIIEVQKKISEILGISQHLNDSEGSN